MKKLMTFCFVILCGVLSALSCFNFAFDALDQIEKDKISIVIDKPESINNTDFLAEIDHALEISSQKSTIRWKRSMQTLCCAAFKMWKVKPTINISRPAIPQTFWMSAPVPEAISWKMANVFPPQPPLGIPSIG